MVEQAAFGPYVFHLDRGELRRGEETVHLTDRERELLRILAVARGETVPRSALTGGGGNTNGGGGEAPKHAAGPKAGARPRQSAVPAGGARHRLSAGRLPLSH